MDIWTPEVIGSIGAIILGLLGALFSFLRYIMKTFLQELKPNGGSSLADKVDRLETRIDQIYTILIEKRTRRK